VGDGAQSSVDDCNGAQSLAGAVLVLLLQLATSTLALRQGVRPPAAAHDHVPER